MQGGGKWEQLIQILAELLVVTHILKPEWNASTTFESEPSVKKQRKNPEHVVSRFAQQEVISGLLNNQQKTTFHSLDAVVVISQLHQILRACEDKPLFDKLLSP